LIAGFEKGLIDMNKRENDYHFKEEAYGESREDLIQEVDKSQLPEDITPEVGMGLVSKSADGNEMNLLIVEVKEATIVIDGNHPLAGKELTFDLEVVDIQE
jgi:FKBP-type peptidyl-prolyl cis-trans isomerase SlpA